MSRVRNIWVIDDDDVFQFTISKIFKILQLPEKVHTFSDGEKAIEHLTNNMDNAESLPDIILLDINMPIMDGWQFLEEYSKVKKHLKKAVVIYLVTSSVDARDIRLAKEFEDISEYITKPMSFDKVRELVGQKKAAQYIL
jgi:CheY-like chemotaxis protein